MLLPKSGGWVEFRRHGSHVGRPSNTIHIGDIWASEAEKLAGNPPVTWDETIAWNGPHANPAQRIIEVFDGRVPTALKPLPAGQSHLCAGTVAAISDKPDAHGNLAHPSMAALKAVPA